MVTLYNSLIEGLITLQKNKGLNDIELAKAIGIDNSTWCRIKRGERQPGVRFLNGVLKAFPALKPLVFDYLSNRNNHDS